MKNQWLWIMGLVTAGVIALGIPGANAADCLDHLAGNRYRCEGVGAGSGGILFFLDFTAATGDSTEFTGRFESVDLLCACGYKGNAATPRFGVEKTVSLHGEAAAKRFRLPEWGVRRLGGE